MIDILARGLAKQAVSISPIHKFATDSERDNYFITKPSDLKDKLYCFNGGKLQQHINGTWIDATIAIKGEKGDVGEKGNQGIQGKTGLSGIYFGSVEPTDENINIWINPYDNTSTLAVSMSSTELIYMTETTAIIKPNKMYVWGEIPTLSISLEPQTNVNILSEYMFQFTSGNLATTLLKIDGVNWYDDIPIITSNKTYQASIVNGIGMIVGV